MKKISLSSILSQLLLLFFVIVWIIPTFGLFISSLRDKDLLAISGWWTALTTTEINEIYRPKLVSVVYLKKENITENVIHVGDIMYDAVKLFKKNDTIYDLEKLLKFKIHKPLAILTIHREYATCNKNNLLNLINFIHPFVRKYQIIFPIHPRTKLALKNFEIKLDKSKVIVFSFKIFLFPLNNYNSIFENFDQYLYHQLILLPLFFQYIYR